MKVKAKLNCECGSKTDVTFKKPDFFMGTFGTFICDMCESKYKYLIKKSKVKGQFIVNQGMVEMSKILQEIKIEEQKAKEVI
jgi:hypothetical protein